jgi:hypothetical protein
VNRQFLTRSFWCAVASTLLIASSSIADAAGRPSQKACSALGIDAGQSAPLSKVDLTGHPECKPGSSNGYPIPDPSCTPGAVNPTLTLEVLKDPNFKTGCVRDQASTAKEKRETYDWYGIPAPKNNTGKKQVCELDHLVSLELGGADTLDNIWPQCGPSHAVLKNRYFKQKDMVENYLAAQVRAGAIPLKDAQKGIAADWTQYLDEAKKCLKAKTKCPKGQADYSTDE